MPLHFRSVGLWVIWAVIGVFARLAVLEAFIGCWDANVGHA